MENASSHKHEAKRKAHRAVEDIISGMMTIDELISEKTIATLDKLVDSPITDKDIAGMVAEIFLEAHQQAGVLTYEIISEKVLAKLQENFIPPKSSRG